MNVKTDSHRIFVHLIQRSFADAQYLKSATETEFHGGRARFEVDIEFFEMFEEMHHIIRMWRR